MQLPSTTPEKFKALSREGSDQELFQALAARTDEFIDFFCSAAEDETWSSEHGVFYELALAWLTRQYVEGKLLDRNALRLIQAFQEHYAILKSYLPRPVEIELSDHSIACSPLVLGTLSPYFRIQLKQLPWYKGHQKMKLTGQSLILVDYALKAMESGAAEDLWKFEESWIEKLLLLAEEWGASRLAGECQEVLTRYISKDEVEKQLAAAYHMHRTVLLKRCVEIFNEKHQSGMLFICGEWDLGFEFYDFTENAFSAFEYVKRWIIRLHLIDNLIADVRFKEVLESCPKLISLDLSKTTEWSPYFDAISGKVYELNLSQCSWLEDRLLGTLAGLLPNVSSLSLAQNTQLTYKGFALLKGFRSLRGLSLARCSQLDGESLSLIIQGAPSLSELDLAGCRKVSDAAFYEIGKKLPHMRKLNLSRSLVTDGVLVDICSKCREMEALYLNHCLNISLNGLRSALEKAQNLRRLEIQENRFDLLSLHMLEKAFPVLSVHVSSDFG